MKKRIFEIPEVEIVKLTIGEVFTVEGSKEDLSIDTEIEWFKDLQNKN